MQDYNCIMQSTILEELLQFRIKCLPCFDAVTALPMWQMCANDKGSCRINFEGNTDTAAQRSDLFNRVEMTGGYAYRNRAESKRGLRDIEIPGTI